MGNLGTYMPSGGLAAASPPLPQLQPQQGSRERRTHHPPAVQPPSHSLRAPVPVRPPSPALPSAWQMHAVSCRPRPPPRPAWPAAAAGFSGVRPAAWLWQLPVRVLPPAAAHGWRAPRRRPGGCRGESLMACRLPCGARGAPAYPVAPMGHAGSGRRAAMRAVQLRPAGLKLHRQPWNWRLRLGP